MNYKRKNSTIEAIQYNGGNAEEIKNWAGESAIQEKQFELKEGEHKHFYYLNLITPSGLCVVFNGDFIVKEGDIFYPLNEKVFKSIFQKSEGIQETVVQSVKIDYQCPVCKIGFLRPTGGCYTTEPPVFPHKCNNENCNYSEGVRGKMYPYIEHK